MKYSRVLHIKALMKYEDAITKTLLFRNNITVKRIIYLCSSLRGTKHLLINLTKRRNWFESNHIVKLILFLTFLKQ